MDASVPVLFDDTSILIPFPDMSDRLSYLLKPFHIEVIFLIFVINLLVRFYTILYLNKVWFGVIVSSFVCGLTLWVINRRTNFKKTETMGFAYWQECSVRIILNQGMLIINNFDEF